MITELNIKNFAIIDELHLEFGPGLNALTGETGAGKSILVDAINLLLGSRASSEMIRTGSEEAWVEAFFELGDAESSDLLQKFDLQRDSGILVKRLVQRSGKSRANLNGNSITLHMLENLAGDLVNIYGQHEHQDFLDPLKHIDILDRSGDLLPLRQAYQEIFGQWEKSAIALHEMISRQRQRNERLELLDWQSKEIARANLQPREDEELAAERARLIHAEKLHALAHQDFENLYGENGSVIERLKGTRQHLREGGKIDPLLLPLGGAVETVLFQLEDVASSLRAYRDKIQFDPKRLEMVEARLDEIQKLKKKYGPTLDEIFRAQERIDEEKKTLENTEEAIAQLKKETADLYLQALSSAQELSQKRKEVARKLSAEMEAELSTLGMKKVRFAIQVEAERTDPPEGPGTPQPRLKEKGMDLVDFLISPNPGEDLKSLAKIASGGELSRIMLALKRIFARETSVQTLVFDEVDAGIGGGVAEVVGRKLKEISRRHQVFCITHLPQIASFADTHYRVAKKTREGRTFVEVKRLDPEERVQEIARMLGGIKLTGKTLEHAQEMLKNILKNV